MTGRLRSPLRRGLVITVVAVAAGLVTGGTVLLTGHSAASVPPLARQFGPSMSVSVPITAIAADSTSAAQATAPTTRGPSQAPTTSPPSSTKTTADRAAPRDWLDYPGISADGTVVSIGCTPTGSTGCDLAVPADVHKLGLWTGGAQPGDPTGDIVITAHVNYVGQGNGVLWRLGTARAGQVIRLTWHGTTYRYRVDALRAYPKTHGVPDSYFYSTGPTRLVLITCGGDLVDGNYQSNVVVTARPADQ